MLQRRNLRPRRAQFGIRLHQFEARCIAGLELTFRQIKGIFPRFERLLRYPQLFVQREQSDIACRHRRGDGQVRRRGGGFLRRQTGLRRAGGAAVSAPDINIVAGG